MRRREANLLLNWNLLGTSFATLSTGLILLIRFHMGEGTFATSAWGVSRLFWLNAHRLSAVAVVAIVVAHLCLHWRAFRNALAKVGERTRNPIDSELIMYVAFATAMTTAFVAWFVLSGSSPLTGPVIAAHANAARHAWIDVHNISSIVFLVLVIHHTGHRWKSMIRRKPSNRPVSTVAA